MCAPTPCQSLPGQTWDLQPWASWRGPSKPGSVFCFVPLTKEPRTPRRRPTASGQHQHPRPPHPGPLQAAGDARCQPKQLKPGLGQGTGWTLTGRGRGGGSGGPTKSAVKPKSNPSASSWVSCPLGCGGPAGWPACPPPPCLALAYPSVRPLMGGRVGGCLGAYPCCI